MKSQELNIEEVIQIIDSGTKVTSEKSYLEFRRPFHWTLFFTIPSIGMSLPILFFLSDKVRKDNTKVLEIFLLMFFGVCFSLFTAYVHMRCVMAIDFYQKKIDYRDGFFRSRTISFNEIEKIIFVFKPYTLRGRYYEQVIKLEICAFSKEKQNNILLFSFSEKLIQISKLELLRIKLVALIQNESDLKCEKVMLHDQSQNKAN